MAEKKGYGRFIDALKKKFNLAVVCGGISLAAIGCGGEKKTGPGDVNERQPPSQSEKASEVRNKIETKRDALLNQMLKDMSLGRFNFADDGSLFIQFGEKMLYVPKDKVKMLKQLAGNRAAHPYPAMENSLE